MLPTASIYAALILPHTRGADVKTCLAAATRVLAAQDARDDGAPFQLPHRQAVHGARHAVRVLLEENSDVGPRLVIEVADRRGEDTEAAAAILSAITVETLRDCPADLIEWGAPGAYIECDEFITLSTYVSPRRASEDQDTGVLLLPADVLVTDATDAPAWRAARTPVSALSLQASNARMTLHSVLAAVALPATALSAAIGMLRA